MKVIKFVIDKNSKVFIDYQGFVGKQCTLEASKIYDEIMRLGVNVKVKKVNFKPEYYVEEQVSVRAWKIRQ